MRYMMDAFELEQRLVARSRVKTNKLKEVQVVRDFSGDIVQHAPRLELNEMSRYDSLRAEKHA